MVSLLCIIFFKSEVYLDLLLMHRQILINCYMSSFIVSLFEGLAAISML